MDGRFTNKTTVLISLKHMLYIALVFLVVLPYGRGIEVWNFPNNLPMRRPYRGNRRIPPRRPILTRRPRPVPVTVRPTTEETRHTQKRHLSASKDIPASDLFSSSDAMSTTTTTTTTTTTSTATTTERKSGTIITGTDINAAKATEKSTGDTSLLALLSEEKNDNDVVITKPSSSTPPSIPVSITLSPTTSDVKTSPPPQTTTTTAAVTTIADIITTEAPLTTTQSNSPQTTADELLSNHSTGGSRGNENESTPATTDYGTSEEAGGGGGESVGGPSGGMESAAPCTATDSDPALSYFGQYGIIAFSISTGLAFILLYALLMVLCLPRFTNRKDFKTKAAASSSDMHLPGVFRPKPKKVRNNSCVPTPLAMIVAEDLTSTSSARDFDMMDRKKKRSIQVTDLDESSDAVLNGGTHEDSLGMSSGRKKSSIDQGNVSTFLLRQTSLRQAEERKMSLAEAFQESH